MVCGNHKFTEICAPASAVHPRPRSSELSTQLPLLSAQGRCTGTGRQRASRTLPSQDSVLCQFLSRMWQPSLSRSLDPPSLGPSSEECHCHWYFPTQRIQDLAHSGLLCHQFHLACSVPSNRGLSVHPLTHCPHVLRCCPYTSWKALWGEAGLLLGGGPSQ